jgi:hypothetical protein
MVFRVEIVILDPVTETAEARPKGKSGSGRQENQSFASSPLEAK